MTAKVQIGAQNRTIDECDGIIELKEGPVVRLEKLLADFKQALYGAKCEKGHLLPGRRLRRNPPGGRIHTTLRWTILRQPWLSSRLRIKQLITPKQRARGSAKAFAAHRGSARPRRDLWLRY
ncbi:hypothetical protein [Roseobacter fucihabitans]|uniref:hypothetical protein n=1 Tax=Roseobacter fucihabitans TaxID=1537242 RepID=UPI001652C5B9|nr:hypothetical protein [Roseobacter litoralis]